MSGVDYLVRLGPPASGAVIHTNLCRHATAGNALRWLYADDHPERDWAAEAPWLKPCKRCNPPSPLRPTSEQTA